MDIEHHKTAYYAKLFRALIMQEFDGPMRSHLIRSFRALSASDFRLVERICKATLSEARSPDANSPEQLIRSFLPPQSSAAPPDPLVHACAENLVSWGYLAHGQRSGILWPTPLARQLAKVLEIPAPRL
jgi:hypothetical protein